MQPRESFYQVFANIDESKPYPPPPRQHSTASNASSSPPGVCHTHTHHTHTRTTHTLGQHTRTHSTHSRRAVALLDRHLASDAARLAASEKKKAATQQKRADRHAASREFLPSIREHRSFEAMAANMTSTVALLRTQLKSAR